MNHVKTRLHREIKGAGLIASAIIFLLTISYMCVRNHNTFYYDSGFYWSKADPCFKDGFNFLKYPETFRGYLLPVLLGVIKQLGGSLFNDGGVLLYRLISAACLTCFITVILPELFDKKIQSVADMIRFSLLDCVILLLWGDFFCYPLSDFTALFFMAGAAALGKHVLRCKKSLLTGAAAVGILLYAAYNTRVTYLYAVMGYFVYVIIGFVRQRTVRPDFFVGILLGALIISCPQSIINHQYIGSYSPKVYTEGSYNNGLQKVQVLWGLKFINYATYVGSGNEYPRAEVYFVSKAGREIAARSGLTTENFTYKRFAKLFIKYPLDMIAAYMIHFVSLMTPMFSETYITDMYPDKSIPIILVLLIWFTALINILRNIQEKRWNKQAFLLSFIIFIPAFLQMAGAPEIRFFIAVHLLGYFYVLCYIDYSSLGAAVRKNILPVVVSFFLFSFLWISVVSLSLSSNQEKALLIHDRYINRIEEVSQ